jgi:CRISPR system Cascade subunit CasA
LITLQTNAPAGGRGHRTSLRGGGPLTTIILGRTLWETVWLNVVAQDEFSGRKINSEMGIDSIFPWMGHTRTSEKGEVTTPLDVNPAQMFWGMPRRIQLEFSHKNSEVICDLCGCKTNDVVEKYRDKSYGINYDGYWNHPLTPYYRIKKGSDEYLPVHGQTSGISYRNWLGLIVNASENMTKPALIVHIFREERQNDVAADGLSSSPLWAFGYKMENAKAICWSDSRMPLIHVRKEIKTEYEDLVRGLILTAELINTITVQQIKKALFKRPGDKKGDFSFISTQYWHDTESAFYLTVNYLQQALLAKEEIIPLKREWIRTLSQEGLKLFDLYSQTNIIEQADPKRIAIARKELRIFSSENNKKIRDPLGIPKPSKKTDKSKTDAR